MAQKTRRLPKSITFDEFKLLMEKVPKKKIKTKIAFLLGYGSGMRISEVLKLSADKIGENSIQITQSKYNVDRVVPIPKGWKEDFNSMLPLGIPRRTLQGQFERARDKAKLNPEYTFHSLRHGFATRLTEEGMPITQVQLLLGHSNVATTNVYTRARPMDALKKYEELF